MRFLQFWIWTWNLVGQLGVSQDSVAGQILQEPPCAYILKSIVWQSPHTRIVRVILFRFPRWGRRQRRSTRIAKYLLAKRSINKGCRSKVVMNMSGACLRIRWCFFPDFPGRNDFSKTDFGYYGDDKFASWSTLFHHRSTQLFRQISKKGVVVICLLVFVLVFLFVFVRVY